MSATSTRLAHARLVGEGVALRPVRPEDAAVGFPLIHRREEVTRWLCWDGPDDEVELRRAYGSWRVGDGAEANYRLAIEAEQAGFVGTLSLRFQGHPGLGDVGYWVASRHWGRGIGTEANRLAAWLAFEHLRARALTAVVFVGNDPSARLLEKVGYRREVDARGAPLVGRPTEYDRDSWTYGLTPLDFRAARGDWRPREEEVSLEPSGSPGSGRSPGRDSPLPGNTPGEGSSLR